MKLGREEYLVAQRAYDGWSLFSVLIFAALISSFVLTIALNREGRCYAAWGLKPQQALNNDSTSLF